MIKLKVDKKSVIIRYEKQNLSVASCTSDVITEKDETDKKIQQTSQEIEVLQKVVKDIEEELKKNTTELGQVEANIEVKKQELQSHIRDSSSKSNGLGILAAIVPFVGAIVKSIYDTATGPGVAAKTQALSNELSQLCTEKSNLRNKEWTIQVRLTDMQLKLASMKIEQGESLSHTCMDKIFLCVAECHTLHTSRFTYK